MNLKKLFSLVFSLAFVAPAFAYQTKNVSTLYFPANYSYKRVNQTECKVFWDIHKTLVKRDKKEFFKSLSEHSRFIATQLLHCFYEKFIHNLTGKKGPLLQLLEERRKLESEDCSGEGYYELCKNYDPRLADLVSNMAKAYKPIAGMPELVQEIPCEQLYASNIGKRFLANLQKKELDEHFPSISGGQVIAFDKKQKALTFNQENNFATVSYKTQKPNILFFGHIQMRFNPDEKNTLIFVDNKLENVIAAQEIGFIVIHFKNPEQLKTDLQFIGLIE